MDDFDRILIRVVDGLEVRPLLKNKDLELIRKALIVYLRSGIDGSDKDDILILWSRFFKKTGIIKVRHLRKGWRDYKDGCAKADRVIRERSSCLECPFERCLLEIKDNGGNGGL